jgi:hypothetical protein
LTKVGGDIERLGELADFLSKHEIGSVEFGLGQ